MLSVAAILLRVRIVMIINRSVFDFALTSILLKTANKIISKHFSNSINPENKSLYLMLGLLLYILLLRVVNLIFKKLGIC